jgi:hypothetical protein
MSAPFHPDMLRNDLGPQTACPCGLPACRSGHPFPERERQEALSREPEQDLEATG